jgi:TonB family protein
MMQPIRLIFRNFARAILFSIFAIATAQAQDAPTYQSQVNSIAEGIAHDVQQASQPKPPKGDPPQKILVADFVGHRGHIDALGQQLASAISDALQARLAPGAVIPPKQFRERMQSAGISPTDLQTSSVLQWQASQAGATILITGRLTRAEDVTTLELTRVSLPDAEARSTSSTDLTLPPEIAKLSHDPEDWSPNPNAPITCPSLADSKGTTAPKCILCKPVEFTSAARKAKWQGKVLLKVSIDEQGQVTSAIVLAGAPYGVSEQALATLRQWTFQPATKDNQAVRICVPVEVTLHSY